MDPALQVSFANLRVFEQVVVEGGDGPGKVVVLIELIGMALLIAFNTHSEPIVCTPIDTHRCFRRTAMDVLVLENHILLREEQPPFKDDEGWRAKYTIESARVGSSRRIHVIQSRLSGSV